jgi:Protein of unknown function (DUF402)
MTFSPGDTIVLQEIWRDRVWAARPMTVVRDDGDLVMLWFPFGTRWKAPTTPPTRPREIDRGERLSNCAALGDWVFRDLEWDVSTLSLMRENDWHALWVSWRNGGEPLGWYVNLQEPFRRSRRGFETMDLALDLVIDLDRTWRWKDEDELERFVTRGLFSEDVAGRIRREAVEVARRAEANRPPFDEPWHDWRPDPAWGIPTLPDRWDELWR